MKHLVGLCYAHPFLFMGAALIVGLISGMLLLFSALVRSFAKGLNW